MLLVSAGKGILSKDNGLLPVRPAGTGFYTRKGTPNGQYVKQFAMV
jgi:hypothetical protein